MSASDDHRLVALRLHGLADSDRRWILSRLSDTDRIKLEGYLEELKGFQLDPETMAELEQRIADSTSAAMISGKHSVSQGFSDHCAEQALAAEPLWLSRLLQPESSDHRIGTVTSGVTPRVRAVAEEAFKRQVLSLEQKRKIVDVRPEKLQGPAGVYAKGMFARLRAAWLR
jgi:hypothetical protein